MKLPPSGLDHTEELFLTQVYVLWLYGKEVKFKIIRFMAPNTSVFNPTIFLFFDKWRDISYGSEDKRQLR